MGLHRILKIHPALVSSFGIAKVKQLLPSASLFSPISRLSWQRCLLWSRVFLWLGSYSSLGLCFESDALLMINAINDSTFGTSYRHIIQDISHAQSSFDFCSFKHLNRSFNFAAHELAQFARRNGSAHLWKGVTPPFLDPIVQFDMLLFPA